MTDNERLKEVMMADAVSVCKQYGKVRLEKAEAEQAWRRYLEIAEEAVLPKEKKIYETLADEELQKFMEKKAWLDRADKALEMVDSSKAYMVLKQHCYDGVPLRQVKDAAGRYFKKSTAEYYKKVGMKKLARALYVCAEENEPE